MRDVAGKLATCCWTRSVFCADTVAGTRSKCLVVAALLPASAVGGAGARCQLMVSRSVRCGYGITRSAAATPPPGTLLCGQIPVRTEHWDVEGPGFIEADTVAHCGESMTGEFCWSSPGLPGSTPPASPSRRYRCPSRPIPTQWLHSSTPAQRHRIDLQRPRHCLPPRLAPHRDLPLHGRQCSAPHTSPRLLPPIRGKLPIDLRRADLRYPSPLSHLQSCAPAILVKQDAPRPPLGGA